MFGSERTFETMSASPRRQHRAEDGFTLVEILVAIVLVGILGSVAVVGIGAVVQRGQTASCQTSKDAATTGLVAHLTSTGGYPASFHDMVNAGVMSMPNDATIDAAGITLSTERWRLVFTPGSGASPPAVACSDGSDFQVWSGMFERSASTNSQAMSDVMVPVDITESYVVTMMMRSGDDAGGQIDPTTLHYAGFASYDADLLPIYPSHVLKVAGSSDTTLAAPLAVGATTMTLTDAAGWYSGSSGHSRQFSWWPYTDAQGTTWAPYTYTRNVSQSRPGYPSSPTSGTWAEGGVSGNTITLVAPWPGPALPAGTPVRNNRDAGTYVYSLRANQTVPGSWTTYTRTISGVQSAGEESTSRFRPGTAYVKLLVLANYTNAGTNLLRWKNGSFALVS